MNLRGERSQQLSDQDELRSLSVEYAAAVDDRDGEGLSRLFVADGELVVPNLHDDLEPVIIRSGHDALRRVPDGLRRFDRTFHQLSNHRYAVEGGLASGRVQCVAHHVTSAPDGTAGDGTSGDGTAGDGTAGTDVVWYIRYRDDYRRTDGGWKFVRRELHLQWVEDRPISSMGPPDGGVRR
jgi:hypothetical protein